MLACPGMAERDTAIEAVGLVREFKKGPRAVDGIDLTVAAGEVYGFLGPNGAGKSTTVHMLTTLLPPTDGVARVAGHDVVKEGAAASRLAWQAAARPPLRVATQCESRRRLLVAIATAEGVETPKAQTWAADRFGMRSCFRSLWLLQGGAEPEPSRERDPRSRRMPWSRTHTGRRSLPERSPRRTRSPGPG